MGDTAAFRRKLVARELSLAAQKRPRHDDKRSRAKSFEALRIFFCWGKQA